MFETGHFATLWRKMASRLGLEVDFVAGDWRQRRRSCAWSRQSSPPDRAHAIKAVMRGPQRDLDRRDEPHIADPRGDRPCAAPGALHGRHDLLARLDRLPPRRMGRRRHRRGLAERAACCRRARRSTPSARRRSRRASRRGCRGPTGAGTRCIATNRDGYFPYTPSTNLLYGLRESIAMLLDEEGLPAVFARHRAPRRGDAARGRAHGVWRFCCRNPREEYSDSLTAILMPEGHDADRLPRASCSSASTCRSAPGWASSRARCSASAISATSTTSCCAARWPASRWASSLAGVPHRAGGLQAAIGYLAASLNSVSGTARAWPLDARTGHGVKAAAPAAWR